MRPLLVSTPHCSAHVPHWLMASMLESGEPAEDLEMRLLREGDPFTDRIFHFPESATTLNALASRFVADLNREREEGGENGVLKLTDFERKPFFPAGYTVSEWERELRLSLYYDPFHLAMASALSTGLVRFFIDGHSMLAQGPPIGPDQGEPRPAFCIGNFGDQDGEPLQGNGPVSCEPWLARHLLDRCRHHFSDLLAEASLPSGPCLNLPFDGGHILRKYSAAPFSVPGVMIEVNRALYLDEQALRPLPGRVERLRKGMSLLAEDILAATAR